MPKYLSGRVKRTPQSELTAERYRYLSLEEAEPSLGDPLVGPSSILLSLIASGLNGQRFTFLGYLPSEKNERVNKLKEIEKQSQKHNETQIFIETPYRNQHMFEDILEHCNPNTKLCLARNISFGSELIATKTVTEWKKSELPDLHRQPTVFLILA